MRQTAKNILHHVGLLEAAYGVRDAWGSLKSTPRNARHWFRGSRDGLPVPPVRLIQAVTGTPDIDWFLEGGARAAESLRTALARNGLDLSQFRAVLDFGCGCGRVIRHWASLDAEVHGSDTHLKAIAWCRRRLPFARFATNALEPPLPYADRAFDFIYALSVLTHLTERLQLAWMDELHRVLAPGGHLVITTHGRSYLDVLSSEERAAFESGRLVVRNESVPGSNRCGAYHPESFVREKLGARFEVKDFIPQGAKGNPHQDLFLFEKAPH